MKAWIVIFPAALMACQFIQKNVKDPAVNLYRRGSCVSIDIPPITLTPARTAAERQLIGEDQEIEKDGWLLASARSTSRTSEADGVRDARRIYREQAILEFYEEPLREYARAGILGEDLDQGLVSIMPEHVSPRSGRFRSPEEVEQARRVAVEINRSRSYLVDYHLKRGKETANPESAAFVENLKSSYGRNTRPGDWAVRRGAWTRQR